MQQKNERKVISKKQMSTKLLDSFFGWGILFGIAVGIVQSVIDIPLAKFLKGTAYSIVTAIITLICYAVQWMFTARIAVKKTFEKYTINKAQSKGILNKSIILYSVLNLLVACVNVYAMTYNLNYEIRPDVISNVNVTLSIILQAIISVGAVGIIIYMTNSQKEYIETQCVENMPEEKLKMSVAEIILIIIIVVILVVAIGLGIKVGVIDRQALENDEYDYVFFKDEEEVDYNDIENLYNKQEELVNDAEEATKKSDIAEAKSLVSLLYAKHLYKQEGEEYVKISVEDLEKLINDELLKEFGQGYTVTLSEDYKITYNFEIE